MTYLIELRLVINSKIVIVHSYFNPNNHSIGLRVLELDYIKLNQFIRPLFAK